MEIAVGTLASTAADLATEVVEHKGIGHPDSICDSLAEAFGLGLARFYMSRFDRLQHFNVDKALLVAGMSQPAFGGGAVLAPMRLLLSGRATREVGGVRVPIDEIAETAVSAWVRENMHALDPDLHLAVSCMAHEGATSLVGLFETGHQSDAGHRFANDTSIGTGFWPLSPLERAVRAAGDALRNLARANPAVGEDTKVMGIRHAGRVHLMVACATVDAHLSDAEAYLETRRTIAREVATAAHHEIGHEVSVDVNAADDVEEKRFHLTVTGTSAEAGDDGQVGRGNRPNGLITPYRPMSLEAIAGKNPDSHTGKLYSIAAERIARHVVEQVENVTEATSVLVSRIGRSVQDPVLCDLRLRTLEGEPTLSERRRAQEVARAVIDHLPRLAAELLRHPAFT